MFKKLFRLPDDMTPQARTLFAAVALIDGVLVLGVIAFILLAARTTGYMWQFWAIVLTAVITVVFLSISLRMIWLGRLEPAAWLTFLPLFVFFFVAAASFSGISLPIVNVVIIPVLAVAAGQLLPPRQTRNLVIISMVVSVAILLVDWYIPTARMTIPEFQIVAYILTGILILVFGNTILRRYPTYSLRIKQLVVLLSISLAVMIAFAVASYLISRAQVTADVGTLLQASADSQGRLVGDFLAKQVDMLALLGDGIRNTAIQSNASYIGSDSEIQEELAQLDAQWIAADQAGNDQDPLVASRLNNATASVLREYRQNFPENVEVFVTDQYGALLAATNRTSDYYQADEAWWQAAYNNGAGSVYIGEMEYDESSQTYAVNIAVPIYASNSERVIGVLRTTVTTQSLIEFLASSMQGSKNLYTDILFPSGNKLTENGLEEISPEEQAILRSIARPYSEFTYGGNPSFVSASPVASSNPAIQEVGWSIIVHETRQAALAPLDILWRTIVIIAAVLAGLTVIAALIFARLLSKPIVELTGIAEKVAAGDLTIEAKTESGDEIGQLAATFNSMTRQLRELIGSLEQRVADRTRALETSTEVSRRLSTILDRDRLVKEVVEQLVTAFGYYYAHIYLWDDARENLLMVGGTGEAGRIMLSRGHFIPRGKGLVGRAAETNAVVLVPDTSQEPGWLPNELLPETRAEVAVPISTGDNVLGVFDVQHNVVNGLTEEDARLLQSIASQVAIALQNAEAYAETKRRAEREALVSNINQQIQNAMTIEAALKIAAREVGRALKVKQTSVRLKLAAEEREQSLQ